MLLIFSVTEEFGSIIKLTNVLSPDIKSEYNVSLVSDKASDTLLNIFLSDACGGIYFSESL